MMGGIRNASPNERIKALDAAIAALDRVAVAFSAGTDSTLLLARCLKVLGTDRVLAITADSPTLPRRELEEARALADELGARHMIIATHEMENLDFTGNSPDRCYHCKRELFERMQEVADAQGYACLAYGATADDTADHRPGMWAAREAGAVAPLLDAGLTKDDVRELSRRMGLRTWDKPAMACLSSRLPYGSAITPEALARIEAGENILRDMGFRQVRVRHHDTVARLEVEGDEIPRLLDGAIRSRVVARFRDLGYHYVTVDLAGFRSGSMNDVLAAS
ncbi:MAG: ATP-dependent sacrificial sulfur transferase LarE [Anaerolineae bacterium]|jgi:uncharacterized protein